MRILMCRPQHYGIEYSINPWMDTANKVDSRLALEQWEKLVEALEGRDVQLEYLTTLPGLPDMVFTANAALILNNKAFISNFKYPERKAEEDQYIKWFDAHGFSVRMSEEKFEGAGDALFLEDTLICGYGFRSDADVYKHINDHEIKKELVELVDPRFYHLDTCFCPLDNGDYLIFPDAFSKDSLDKIRAIGKRELAVPEDEALRFACNAVLVKDEVILPQGCFDTEDMLREAGYIPYPVPMTEFIKSGGACKCLTLRLD